MRKLNRIGVLALASALVVSFAGCGGGYSYKGDSAAGIYTESESYYGEESNGSYAGDYGYYEEDLIGTVADGSGIKDSGSGAKQDTVADSSRKLIKTVNMTVETDSFDGFTSAVQAKVDELGGYIENLDNYNGSKYGTYKPVRYSNMTIRIPKQNADAFIAMVGEKGNVTNQSLSVSDVTLTYVDLESRKESYETEQQRLMELLEKAETLEEILILEDKLSEVRYMLESMESQLRSYDNKVDYTTIYLQINEVTVYTEPIDEPESYGQRIASSFKTGFNNTLEGLKNFAVVFVGSVPGLIVFALFVLVMFFIIRAIVRAIIKASRKMEASSVTYNVSQPVYPVNMVNVPVMPNEEAPAVQETTPAEGAHVVQETTPAQEASEVQEVMHDAEAEQNNGSDAN